MALFTRPALIDPRVVPTVDVEVDWGHPLASGLVSFYAPGISPNDLADNGPTLQYSPETVITSGPSGVGLDGSQPNSVAYANITPPIYSLGTSGGSLFWLGDYMGPTSNSSLKTSIFGVVYSNSSTEQSPYFSFAFIYDPQNVAFRSQNNYSLVLTNPSYPASGSLGVSFSAAGESVGYVNGQLIGTSAQPAIAVQPNSLLHVNGYLPGPITRTANTRTNAGVIYNTQLTADRHAWLEAEPFAVLRPRAPLRTWSIPSGGVLPALTIDLSISTPTPTLTTSTSLATTLDTSATLLAPTLSSDVTVTAPLGSIVIDFSATTPVPSLTDATAAVVTALSLIGVTPAPTLTAQATSISNFDLSAITPNAMLLGETYNMLTIDLTTTLPAPTLAATVTVAGNDTPTNVGQPMHLRSIQLIPYRVDDNTLKGLA